MLLSRMLNVSARVSAGAGDKICRRTSLAVPDSIANSSQRAAQYSTVSRISRTNFVGCRRAPSWVANRCQQSPMIKLRSLATGAEQPTTPSATGSPSTSGAAADASARGSGNGTSTNTGTTPTSDASSASNSSGGSTSVGTIEERLQRLEIAFAAQQAKLEQVEKAASKRGGLMKMMTEYGFPMVVWYILCWSGSFLSIYLLLETGVISWQESLLPLLESIGMDAIGEKVSPSAGNFLIAFLVNECLESIRFPIVLATFVPFAKMLKRFRNNSAGGTAVKAAN